MKKKHALISALLVLLTAAFSVRVTVTTGSEDKDKGKSEVTWLTFEEGIAAAKEKNKLLVIDFYTDWCHWCKVMDKETYANEDVIKYAEKNVVMAKLNAETNEKFKFKDGSYSGRELSMMFGVRGFPTTVFMNGKGELLTSVSGFIPAEKFTKIMKYLSEKWYEKMKFDEFEKKQEAPNKS